MWSCRVGRVVCGSDRLAYMVGTPIIAANQSCVLCSPSFTLVGEPLLRPTRRRRLYPPHVASHAVTRAVEYKGTCNFIWEAQFNAYLL